MFIFLNLGIALLANPHLGAILKYLCANSRWAIALGTYQHEFGERNRRLPCHTSARLPWVTGAFVLGYEIHILHNRLLLGGRNTQDFTSPAFVLGITGKNQNPVFLSNPE